MTHSAGTNLTHLLPTGNSTAESLPCGAAANTSSWILDLKVKVVTVQGKEIVGEVFTYDPLVNCLVLKTENNSLSESIRKSPTQDSTKLYNFQILKINAIQNITPINSEDITAKEAKVQNMPIDHVMLSSTPSPRFLNLDAFVLREQKNVAELRDSLLRTNTRAPEGGQEIFDALSKMFPCTWDKNDIVVLEEVRIKPSYRAENCESLLPAYDLTLDRVKKTLESERKKLNLDRSPVSTPQNYASPKPGSSVPGKKEGQTADKLTDSKKEKKDFSRK